MTFEEQRQKLKKEMHEALDKAFDDPKTPVFLDGKYTFIIKDGYLLIVSVLPNEYAAFKRKTQEKR